MLGFLDLPGETRNEIYHYALVRPHILVPERPRCQRPKTIRHRSRWLRDEQTILPTEDEARTNRPTLALLRLCKTVNVEATPIFYSDNRFGLPMNIDFETSIFGKYKHLIHHVIVEYGTEDNDGPLPVPHNYPRELLNAEERFLPSDYEGWCKIFDSWTNKTVVTFMLPNLKTVVVDLTRHFDIFAARTFRWEYEDRTLQYQRIVELLQSWTWAPNFAGSLPMVHMRGIWIDTLELIKGDFEFVADHVTLD